MASAEQTQKESVEADEAEAILDEMEEDLNNGVVPAEVNNNQALYERELEKIFGRCWLFVGHVSEIPDPGDYTLRYLGEDPYIFVRDEDGEIQVLFDRCQHRGTKLCQADQGNTSHFRCPYHGWTYNNSGELIGVPHKEKAYQDIDQCEYSLFKAPQVSNYSGFVFASLDEDAPPLEDFLGDATWYLDLHFKIADWEVIAEPHRWQVNLDWKNVAENASADNYHVSIGHKSATDIGLGPSTGTDYFSEGTGVSKLGIKCEGYSASYNVVDTDESLFWGYPSELVEEFRTDELSDEQLDLSRRTLVTVANIFPNLNINISSSTNDPDRSATGTFLLRQWQPRGPGKIEIWDWCLAPKSASEEFKERTYQASTGAFSIGGNFFIDDLAILQGIADTAESVTTKKHKLKSDYTMGRDGTSITEENPDWPGPGTAYENAVFTDQDQLNIYENWHKWMTQP